jgi:RNA polymerase sigma factor (sigma-70 family)
MVMSTIEFYTLLMKEQRLLNSVAMKLTMDQDDAKDLIQDTILKAIKYKDSFIRTTNLKAWLCVIMKNTFINAYRRAVRKNRLIGKSFDFAKDSLQTNIYSNTTDTHINYKELLRVIDLLKDEFKLPFMLFVDGYKYKEISDELDLPLGTVKSRIFIARKELIEKLKNEYNLSR